MPRMSRLRSALPLPRAAATLTLAATLGLAACSDSSEPQAAAEAPTSADAPAAVEHPAVVDEVAGRTIIDVRTPEEFADGHLEGAVNIDVQDPAFEEQVADLDPEGSYFLYCRSGNRSAAAAARMVALGFDDVVDGGAFESLVAAGVPAA